MIIPKKSRNLPALFARNNNLTKMMENNKENLKNSALDYHRAEPKGKIQMVPSKPYATQWDLSLAYSPGVAEPCLEIKKGRLQGL